MDFSTSDNIKNLAIEFAALGGMNSVTDQAIAAHEKLANAVDSAKDYVLACAIARAIVKGFDY